MTAADWDAVIGGGVGILVGCGLVILADWLSNLR